MPNNLLQDNTNNTTNGPTLMKQGGGVPSNETPLSATTNNVGELENKDLLRALSYFLIFPHLHPLPHLHSLPHEQSLHGHPEDEVVVVV